MKKEAKSFVRLPEWIAPEAAFARFADRPYTMFFDGGDFSYLCVEPFHVQVDGTLEAVRAELARHAAVAGPVPFCGGAAGFIGYEVGASLDRAPRAPGALAGIPDMLFGFYDCILAFDHVARRVWLFGATEVRREAVLARLAQRGDLAPPPPLAWRTCVSRDTHVARVRAVLEAISAGDIYQANIAAWFEAARPVGLDAAALYLALRAGNPAPFSAYIECGKGCAVLSASPERFVQMDAAGAITTQPIKGTRPRGADAVQDGALAAELLASAKDRAENLMIVDLLRNDIARVARDVTVPSLYSLQSFAHVHHLVSTVRGQIRPGADAIDLLRAAFPGGSITGAPKLRAMEIIAEQEARARGPYCGSAAWIGFDGAMDSNILIRTLTVAADCVVAQAGGGIVADSDPAEEWEEVLVKIMPLLRATGKIQARYRQELGEMSHPPQTPRHSRGRRVGGRLV